MSLPLTNRTPYEVWERILLHVIDVTASPVLETTCTPSTYLAFKRTCGDGDSTAYQHDYRAAEKHRRNLRLVCRAWNEFADRWDTRERWIRFVSLREEISDERWRGVQRLEFVSSGGINPKSGGMGSWDGEDALYGRHRLVAVLFNWKTLGVQGGYGMRLRRLEMLYVTSSAFEDVFKGLCEASGALRELRSLGLAIPSTGGWPLRRLSKHFPKLQHLTLRACFGDGKSGLEDVADDDVIEEVPGSAEESKLHDALRLNELEVLFLVPNKSLFRLSNWSLPSLRHFHVRPVADVWKTKVFPFLERHASTIESLDLDEGTDPTGQTNFAPPDAYDPHTIDFWEIFPSLALLRCRLSRGMFASFPGEKHALQYLVDTEPILDADDLIKVVRPWVERGDVKRLEGVVVFGPYLSRGVYKRDRGPIAGALQQLRWNGIKLLNPAGRTWVDPL